MYNEVTGQLEPQSDVKYETEQASNEKSRACTCTIAPRQGKRKHGQSKKIRI